MKPLKSSTYANSGVDIKREEKAVESIVSIISSTFLNRKGKIGEVKSTIGHFANFVEIGDKYLVMATDGVGTKVLIAQAANKFDTVGVDMIAMNVNDVICVGAEPVSLVDYLAVEKIDGGIVKEISNGLKAGADDAGIAIIGGETASLKGVITGMDGKGFDLAGTCLGIVDKDKTVLGDKIKPGDKIIGVASSGIHSNGYSLVRDIILKKYSVDDVFPWGRPVKDELLTPTRIYVRPVLEVLKKHFNQVTGLCHITGGGLLNLKRLNQDVGFKLDDVLEPQPLFSEIKKLGNVSDEEMYKTFNMGMGFVIVCRAETVDDIVGMLKKMGFQSKMVGEITDKKGAIEVPGLNLRL